MLSQNVSNLETQKNLINDRVVKLVNQESIEDIKLYMKHEVIHLVSEHYKRVNELSNSYHISC